MNRIPKLFYILEWPKTTELQNFSRLHSAHIPHLLLFTSENPLCCSYVIFYAVALSDRQWSTFPSMWHKFLHLLLFLNSFQPRKFRTARLWSKFKADPIQRPFPLNCKKITYTLSLKKGCHTKGFVWLHGKKCYFYKNCVFPHSMAKR